MKKTGPATQAICPTAALLLLVAALAARAVEPSPKALDIVRNLRAFRMGVDHEGSLWSWNQRTARVDLYSPDGELAATARVEEVIRLDADGLWGIATLTKDGYEIRLRHWLGDATTMIPLAERASSITWLGHEEVAVGMAAAAHRIEIWNTSTRARVRTMGRETPVVPKPGLSRVRSYEMRYDTKSGLLYSLESFTGELQVFTLNGVMVRREMVPVGEGRAGIEAWLQQLDKEGREKGEVKSPSITWYWLALDGSGTAWVVQSCDRKQGRARFFEMPPRGVSQIVVVNEPCNSSALAIWGDRMILYQEPGVPPGESNSVRRLP